MKGKRKKILLSVAAILALSVLFLLYVLLRAFINLPGESELLGYKNATASVVISEDDGLIGKIYTENRTNITFDKLPVYLVNALIATEDVRFYEHKGVDSRSLFRVFFKTILFNDQSSGGGSTITQQLAKNMFGRRNSGLFAIFINKTREVLLARRLEKLFSKQEILTLYLNTVPFGENVYGIEAAARRFFNKDATDLDINESAVLVGMLKANNLYNPRINPANSKNRRNVVLGQMSRYNYIEKATAESLSKLPLVISYNNIEQSGPADYFLFKVKNEAKQILDSIVMSDGKKWNVEEDGLIITTTLNLALQKIINSAIATHLSEMQTRLDKQYKTGQGKRILNNIVSSEVKRARLDIAADKQASRYVFRWPAATLANITVRDSIEESIKLLHAGVIAVNPENGAIKAWAGGIDFKTNPYDQVLARRQMGSTFKPILYSEALEEGISPCYYLDNDSVVVSGPTEWSPKNYDLTYGGKYSLTGALVHSMNIPTFNLYMKIGFTGLDSLWKRLGFSFRINNTPSLAMGTAEASVKEVAAAYSVLANGGFKVELNDLISIKAPDGTVIWENKPAIQKLSVLTERTSSLINAMLSKAVREGTGSSLASVYGVNIPLAGKTGTTQDYADAWFAGYNPSLVIVSRVGASLPSVHFTSGSNGSGSTLALPLAGITLAGIQNDPVLRNMYSVSFPELSIDLLAELECPDFRDKNMIENFINIFKKDKDRYDVSPETHKIKKESFFRRLFKRRR